MKDKGYFTLDDGSKSTDEKNAKLIKKRKSKQVKSSKETSKSATKSKKTAKEAE